MTFCLAQLQQPTKSKVPGTKMGKEKTSGTGLFIPIQK
ncbi:unnamed protein product [Timema podura]|uniref:Uncharacterized protein n=1 Tax=Timema podura TaxID=61482 RepID=A0ABN7PQ46_TIMPD|nr:unnamed protein product [Timema podura]